MEYNRSIHKVKHWSQKNLTYDFFSIHRVYRMIKDVDSILRYINSFICRYLVVAFIMCSDYICLRSPVYNFDILSTCSNPRHVTNIDILPEHITFSTLSTFLVLYHSAVRFSSKLSSVITNSISYSFPRLTISSGDIIWISIDSVLHCFCSQLTLWLDSHVNRYMLELSALYYRIASCFNFKSSIHFTTLPYCFIIFNAFIIIVPMYLLVFFLYWTFYLSCNLFCWRTPILLLLW